MILNILVFPFQALSKTAYAEKLASWDPEKSAKGTQVWDLCGGFFLYGGKGRRRQEGKGTEIHRWFILG